MRVYKRLIIISAIATVLSLGVAMLLNYFFMNLRTEFWVNVCLGVFGSSILTMFTSIVSYQYERRKTLEGFTYHTRQLLAYLTKYQTNMPLEQKIHFFLNYHDLDSSAWDADFGEMDFFFEPFHKSRKYIYDRIYNPILKFNAAVANHVWHFRWYLDGTGKNECVMHGFVSELEDFLIETTKQEFPAEYDEKGNVISTNFYTTVVPKLFSQIENELSGHYYDIMYSKRANKGANDGKDEI